MRLGVGGLCPHGEDVEYERGAVQYLHPQLRLDVPYLLGGQLVVKYDHADLLAGLLFLLDVLLDFLQLALAYVGDLAGGRHALGEPLHGDGSRRVGQELQLVQVFLGLGLVLLLGDEAHEYGGFGLGL